MRNDHKSWKRKGFDKGGSTTPHVETKAKSKRFEKLKSLVEGATRPKIKKWKQMAKDALK